MNDAENAIIQHQKLDFIFLIDSKYNSFATIRKFVEFLPCLFVSLLSPSPNLFEIFMLN